MTMCISGPNLSMTLNPSIDSRMHLVPTSFDSELWKIDLACYFPPPPPPPPPMIDRCIQYVGTVYIGDGALAVDARDPATPLRDYLDAAAAKKYPPVSLWQSYQACFSSLLCSPFVTVFL